MSFSDSFEFITKLTFGNIDLLGCGLAIVAIGFCILVLGICWGLLWNRKWNFTRHMPTAIASVVIALLAAVAVMQWRAANNALTWLGVQRVNIVQQLAGSGADNRLIFRKAWDKLQPLGGQSGLTPPSSGGNELRINSETEARILVMTAAESAPLQLRIRAPFQYGLPLEVKDASVVASESTDKSASQFPVMVNPANNWVRTGLSAQTAYAFDAAARRLSDPIKSFETLIVWVLAGLLGLQATLVGVSAFRDIREDP